MTFSRPVAVLVLAACTQPSTAPLATASPTSSTVGTSTTSEPPSSATTQGRSTTSSTTTTAPTGLVLAADGLGVTSFGADPEEAVRPIEASLGEPDEDTGWTLYSEMQPGFGVCGGSEYRMVQWGQLGVLFTDNDRSGYAHGAERHFSTYGYGRFIDIPANTPPLDTTEGLTVGDSYGDAVHLYGESAELHQGDEVFEPYITIDLGEVNPLIATLDEAEESGQILSISGGYRCGE